MKVLQFPCQLNIPTAVALGRFDGIHRAHREVISGAVSSKAQGLTPCVFTFSDNPGKAQAEVLNTEGEKLELLRLSGVEITVSSPFDVVRNMTAEEFVREVLHKALGARAVFCGYNYRFGKGAESNAKTLASLCEEYGIFAVCVDEVLVDEKAVSSTAIRALLREGEVEKANSLLGYPYTLSGSVIHGNGIGRTISIPTLNIDVDSNKLLPLFGVYVAEVSVNGRIYPSVCNIGTKPTVGSDEPTVEAYLLDAQGDFYSDFATLRLLSFIRPEKRFSDLESLRAQIEQDVAKAKTFFDKK